MSIRKQLLIRSESACELCGDTTALAVYPVPPVGTHPSADRSILVCGHCFPQLEDSRRLEPNHWRCLQDRLWSPVPAVQVMVWRLLNELRDEGWSQHLLDRLYMDDATLAWAKQTGTGTQEPAPEPHLDSNGQELAAGDTVVLIKDLKVKGANFTAKRGTAVRRISLVEGHPDEIEGRVNDQRIVLRTEFVKKTK